MPNQRAAGLVAHKLSFDEEQKAKFLKICRRMGISGNQAIGLFVRAVIQANPSVDQVTVNLVGETSPARAPGLNSLANQRSKIVGTPEKMNRTRPSRLHQESKEPRT